MISISVLSYNIWFDEFKRYERLNALIDIINKYDPDVICLQEVIPETYEILKSQLVNYPNYFPNELHMAYGCVIFSKYDIVQTYNKFYPETQMGRNLLAITIKRKIFLSEIEGIKTINLTIATSHFESLFGAINSTKTSQYIHARKTLDSMYDSNNPIIFCCDSNILKNEEQYFFTDSSWVDSFIEFNSHISKDMDGFTYDTRLNKNLITRNLKEIRSRIDRILYRGTMLKLTDYKMIQNSISNNLFDDLQNVSEPSDHFGIISTFHLSQVSENEVDI